MKDNLPMLEVKALGGFSMRYGEKTISIKRNIQMH